MSFFLEIIIKAIAPTLFAVLLYPPFSRWVEQSLLRLLGLVFLAEISTTLLLEPLHLGFAVENLVDAAVMVLLISPLLWRLWWTSRESRENLLRLNTLVNTIPDAIFFKDGAGRWLTVNPAGQALFKLEGIAWQGRNDKQLSQLQPDLAEMHRNCKTSDERAWSKGILDVSMETAADDDGNIHHYEVSKVPLFKADGERHALVVISRDITEIEQVHGKLEQVANYDPLTGLPNRRLFNELMEHAIKRAEREHNKIALLFVDLDRFKTINDTLGHHAGDKLLAEVSQRLTDSVRDSDVTARLGGDEFVVMMDMLRDIDDAAVVAKKIIKSISSEFLIDNEEFHIGASIGISIYPDSSRQVGELIKAADIAMYQVKSEGKNSYCFYSVDMSENANERFVLETELRHAIERNQFEVFYQPQISLVSGRILGAEALIRWHHPELGMVSPAKFIPLAEDTGLIIQIGEWVLRESAVQVMQWAAQGFALQWVSVNVSGVQVQRSNFADTVYGVLIETDCDPRLLELEITESTIMRNTEYVIGVFDRIKSLGLRLAIDDFGTGYSSLSHLKRLPLDKLKIDQSFVRDLPFDNDDAAIARAIHALGSSLGLTVIAEGVETAEQAKFLLDIGCDEAQGYLYSPPVSATEFAVLLAADSLRSQSTL